MEPDSGAEFAPAEGLEQEARSETLSPHNQPLEQFVMATVSENAELCMNGQLYELPIRFGADRSRAVDISRLRPETGQVTLDEEYANTGLTTSEIT